MNTKNVNSQKKEKIVITGGLGYVGTQLCKLYSSETLQKEVIVIDNRFLPERVKKLKEWGIKFVEMSILEKSKLKEILIDSDIVYHLAGITDVAYTKMEETLAQAKMIRTYGTIGSRNVIDSCSNKTKIIFPSTHVVFEGVQKATFNINEDVEPCPILTYAKSKYETEKDLAKSGKNYVIVRLGSVYGYGEDSMRYKIMPNLFSKIASQKGTIKLFSGGIQQKSLVSVYDVVRYMKFLAERKDINKEIFHCVNENVTVKDVAYICKEFVPELNIIETSDEIPNEGYTLSNKKILSTGFEFKYKLKESIKEMINAWSDQTEKEKEPLVQILKGSKEYVDKRGRILNYELPELINWVGWIESKKGSVRGNHYHPIQEQKCILLKGKYISVFRDLKNPNAITETKLIQAGDIEIIAPNVAHTMVFLEDSHLLNLVNGEREHENFGKHTIPHVLVDEKHRDNLLKNYKIDCRSCGNISLKRVISLGYSPLANNLLKKQDQQEELFPLEMNYCHNCHNCQLSYIVPPKKMFDNYLYVSSTTLSFRKHFENIVDMLIEKYDLNSDSLVVDIGSNDGIFLKPLKERGIQICGVDPASNICKIANDQGIYTIEGYFDEKICEKIIQKYGKAEIVTAFNVFAHSAKLKSMAKNVFNLLKDKGVFIIEVQYLLDTIKDLNFDNIYHEHVNYWSVTSLNNFFSSLGFQISCVEHINTHGGSIRLYIERKGPLIDKSVNEFLEQEKKFGLINFETYKKFSKKIEGAKANALENIKKIKMANKRIVGYGSPAKATTVLNYFGISNKDIDYIIEDNPLKHNLYLPGMKIPIKDKKGALENPPDYILVLAWNFFEEIKKNNPELMKKGCKFITLKELERIDLQI